MKIFKDIFSGDEVCTDTHPMKPTGNPAVICVQGKFQKVSNAIDESLIGGNKSAEGGDEGTDDAEKTVLNIVESHQLTETGFKNKKEYMKYIKEYMKNLIPKVAEQSQEEVAVFKKGSEEFVKSVIANFDQYQFFMSEKWGEGAEGEGMIILLKFEQKEGDDEEKPYFYFFKHGLVEEKV